MTGKIIPTPELLPDQKKYLQELSETAQFDKEVVRRCNCRIGGPQDPNDPPCPIHGRERRGIQFDPDFSPNHIQNRMAAKKRGWRYDPRSKMYKDEDGALRADKFGQPL